ncbi:MAG: putative aminohydrolase SsnA [Sediminispirochaetaceae bacterium]
MIVIKNAHALQFEPARSWEDVDIVIDGDTIAEVGKGAADKIASDRIEKTIDASGTLVYPGLVCSHHHYYSGFARGIMGGVGPIKDFVTALRNLWWRIDRALDEESLYYSALINSIEAIKMGTTSVIDHHASPSYIRGSLDTIKRAFEEAGLRGMTCYETTDRHGIEDMKAGVEENVAFAVAAEKERQSGKPHLVEAAIGGHAPFTLPDEGLELLGDAVEKTGRGFHVHVGEGKFDVSFSHLHFNRDITDRLSDYGLLNDKALFIHGVHLSPEDVERINAADAYLIHNVRSNMNNGVGYNSRLGEYKNVALGTDGIGANMYEEFRFAFFKHMDEHGGLGPEDYLGFLAHGNDVLQRYFGGRFGRIEKGAKADLVVADYTSPTPIQAENIAGHMAFGMTSTDVRTVLIEGKPVYEDREFPIDIEEIFAKSREAAKATWRRVENLEDKTY